MGWTRVPIGDADLEVDVIGRGEPVLWVQTALTADELLPCATRVAATGRYASIVQHRRGYAGSSPAPAPGSVDRDTGDALALLDGLGVGRCHVVGLSYAGAVAWGLASRAPGRVLSLSLIEPPPLHVPASTEFVAANLRLIRRCQEDGPACALDDFLTLLVGPGWESEQERLLPGSVDQMRRDAPTFFAVDLPALLGWQPDRAALTRWTTPVLSLGGSDSGPWFAQVRAWLRRLFPAAEEEVISGAGHGLALTHAEEVAGILVAFLDRHPSGRGPASAT